MSASSASTMASTRRDRAAARSTGQSAGGEAGGLRTLTTPLNFGPTPTGALSRTQPLKLSLMALSNASTSMLSASILLMTSMRARPRLPASLNMRRVLTSIPLGAEMRTTAVSTACSDSRAAPMKSGAPGASSRWTCLPCVSRWRMLVSMDWWRFFSSSS